MGGFFANVLDPNTRRRLRRFGRIKRAKWALILLVSIFVISLFSNFIANDKPFLVKANGKLYVPVFKFYPQSEFTGGEVQTRPRYKDLEKLPLFQEKRADNLIESLQKAKKCRLEKLLFGFGIRFAGEVSAAEIAKEFRNSGGEDWADFVEFARNKNSEDWVEVEGVGEKVAESLADWFGDSQNLKLFAKLAKLGIEIIHEKKAPQKLEGKTFVVTGTLENFSRVGAKDAIKKFGGRVASSISNKTDFLLAGENAGSKLKKARELGINVLSESDFQKMLD
jgi:DNA ligase (NAD+)